MYFLIFSPFSPIPSVPFSLWQLSKCSLYPQVAACLFIWFYFIDSIFDRYILLPFCCWYFFSCFPLVVLKEDPLAFHVILVWWWWIPLAFSCLRSSLYVLLFWMTALLSRVILVVGPGFLPLWIFCATPCKVSVEKSAYTYQLTVTYKGVPL